MFFPFPTECTSVKSLNLENNKLFGGCHRLKILVILIYINKKTGLLQQNLINSACTLMAE